MRRRNLDIGSRRSSRLPDVDVAGLIPGSTRAGGAADAAGAAGPDAGTVAAGEGEGAEEAAGAAAAEVSRCASTSALVRRPSLPVPEIADESRPCSSTSRRTAGLRRSGPVAGDGAAAAGTAVRAAAGLGAGLAAAPALAPGSIRASTSWLRTVSPVCFSTSASTPASGAGTSSTTLSVSSSIRISSFSTLSPGCLRHSSSVASGTDSASTGTFTSTVTAASPRTFVGFATLAAAGPGFVQRIVTACLRGRARRALCGTRTDRPPGSTGCGRAIGFSTILTRSSCATPPGRGPVRSPPGPAAGRCAR